jgi:hypothetical protein
VSDLERQYRRALARYPRTWRRRNEDALLGVLLDNAEGEGRLHMSQAERHDLATNSRRLRLTHSLPYVLLAIGALALLYLLALVLSGSPLDTQIIIQPPAVPATPIGGSYSPLFAIQLPSWAVYAITVAVLIATTLAGWLLLKHNRSSRSSQ